MNPPSLLQRLLGLVISYTVLRQPVLLTGLPDDVKGSLFSVAHEFLQTPSLPVRGPAFSPSTGAAGAKAIS